MSLAAGTRLGPYEIVWRGHLSIADRVHLRQRPL